MRIKRYGIYWADLNPVIGSEMAKIRPVVVVSDDLMNAHLQTIVVCPLTSRLHPDWRSRITFTYADRTSEIAVDQIRTISKSRITEEIGTLDPPTADALRALIAEMYATE